MVVDMATARMVGMMVSETVIMVMDMITARRVAMIVSKTITMVTTKNDNNDCFRNSYNAEFYFTLLHIIFIKLHSTLFLSLLYVTNCNT